MKILLLGQYHPATVQELTARYDVAQITHGSFARYLPEADVLVVRSHVDITAVDIEQAARLRLIIKAGSGLDNIDVAAARLRGIEIEAAPAASNAVADHTIALLLCAWRRIPLLASELRAGNWGIKYTELGREIEGQTLGILGFGQIGRLMAKRSAALGFRISIFDRSPMKPEKQRAAELIGASFAGLHDLLRSCSAISVHLPLTPETRGMIGQNEFDLLQEGVVLVNTGRAAIFRRSALLAALKSGKIAAAALDVFHAEPLDPEDELLSLPHVICTPHVGAQTHEAMALIGTAVIRKIENHAARPQIEGIAIRSIVSC